jgi:hypothetical protein
MWKTVLLLIVVGLVMSICMHSYKLNGTTTVSDNILVSIIHEAIVKSLHITKITDAATALVLIREAVVTIETATKLAGGPGELGTRTGVDIEQVSGVLMFQERQIRGTFQSSHPLNHVVSLSE